MSVFKRLKWIPLGITLYYIAARIVRQFVKFPMPEFMANVIDNPLRRRAQPPEAMPGRLGVKPGMTVLEIGPGNGRYTLALARHVGPEGRVVALDIEPRMVARVEAHAASEGVTHLEARVGDVYALPYPDEHFDAVVMITVIGELPDVPRALAEFRRVLKPGGVLGLGELLADPDFPIPTRIARLALAAGFSVKRYRASFWQYTLVFEKPADPAQPQQGLAWFDALPRPILRLFHLPPRIAFRLGLGNQLGGVVALLTTTGRNSGLPRTTPLQYELIDGTYTLAAMRGTHADWVRNAQANPRVTLRIKDQVIEGTATVSTDPAEIAAFIAYRLARRPRMIGLILRLDGLGAQPSLAELEAYSQGRALLTVQPLTAAQQSTLQATPSHEGL